MAETPPRNSLFASFAAKPAWVQAVLLTAFCLLLALLLSLRTAVLTPDNPLWRNPVDHHKYIYMAEHPVGSFHIAPPNWRIGVPFLVQALPFPILTGFRVQTFVFIVATAVLLYYVLLAAGYSVIEAFLGVVMFWSYGPANKILISSPYSPDPASFALTALALCFLWKKQDIPLALTLMLAAAVKETIVLVFPLIYTIRAQKPVDLRLLARTVLISLPALATLIAIRLWIPAYNDVPGYVAQMGPQLTQVHLGTATYSFMDALHRVTSFRMETESLVNMFRDLTFGNVGILWLLPFFALKPKPPGPLPESSNWTLLLRFLPFLALTYLGWFVALNADRRFAYAFAFWIMMSLNGLRCLSAGWNIDIAWFIPLFVFQYLLNLIQPVTGIVPVDLAVGLFVLTLGILYSVRDRLTGQTP